MKKNKFLFLGMLALVLTFTLVLAGCPDPQNPAKYTVTYNAGAGATVSPGTASVETGKTTAPPEPTWADHDFLGWFTEEDGEGTEFTDSTPVTGDITVYASWAPTPAKVLADELGTLGGTASVTASGVVTLSAGTATVASTLSIPEGITLIVDTSGTLTVNGTLNGPGTITKTGGAIDGSGTVNAALEVDSETDLDTLLASTTPVYSKAQLTAAFYTAVNSAGSAITLVAAGQTHAVAIVGLGKTSSETLTVGIDIRRAAVTLDGLNFAIADHTKVYRITGSGGGAGRAIIYVNGFAV